jgi:hypothetical protein
MRLPFAAALGLAAACSYAANQPGPTPSAEAAAQPRASQEMTTKTVTLGEEEMLRELGVGNPVQLRIGGEGMESFLGHERCGYFEWLYGEKKGDQLGSYTVAYQSTDPIKVTVGDKESAISPRRVRAYLSPSVERVHAPGDASAPEVVQELMAETKQKVYVAEYCLETGKTYFALVHQDTYLLPPKGPGSAPEHGRRLVLWISDKPFVDGKPEQQVTPAYRGWTY